MESIDVGEELKTGVVSAVVNVGSVSAVVHVGSVEEEEVLDDVESVVVDAVVVVELLVVGMVGVRVVSVVSGSQTSSRHSSSGLAELMMCRCSTANVLIIFTLQKIIIAARSTSTSTVRLNTRHSLLVEFSRQLSTTREPWSRSITRTSSQASFSNIKKFVIWMMEFKSNLNTDCVWPHVSVSITFVR